MSDNFSCFFETSNGVLQDNLGAHFFDKCEISKEISIYALPCFGLTPEVSRSIPNILSTWNTMQNHDCCSEIHNGRCGIFHTKKKKNVLKGKSAVALLYSKLSMETSTSAHED